MASQPDRLADRHRLAQVAVRAATVRSLLALWDALIDPTDLDGSTPVWLDAAMAVVLRRHDESARLAALHIGRTRYAQVGAVGPTPPLVIPDSEATAKALLIRGPLLLKSQMTRVPLEAATKSAKAAQAQAGARRALTGGRQTITQAVRTDPAATGWRRTTSANPCDWCASKAGEVWATDADGGDFFQAHDHCGCGAEPLYQ